MSNDIPLGKNDCDYLRVVLFCKGKGADKDSYRPRSDEKQWWGRRDALARCVASFLFGAKTNEERKIKRELVLLFDEDLSRLHMTVDDDDKDRGAMEYSDAFPKEETIIKLWKQAAQNLRKQVEYKGMKCTILLDPNLSFVPTSSSTKTSKITKASSTKAKSSSSIERIDTKREVLEYIQKHCSIDFLREHRINSHPEVVLRKTNRKALLKIWDTWTEQMHAPSVAKDAKGSKNDDEKSYNSRQLKTIYRELLQFPQEQRSRNSPSLSTCQNDKRIIAGTLHESSEEFPCFRFRPEEIAEQSSPCTSYRVCLFLGAVRDMTSNENELLEEVCEASKIPFVGIRFGTVPEFTSKILSLLVFHHANRVLGSSMKRLLNSRNKKVLRDQSTTENMQQSTCLNIICTVPKVSKEISTRIEDRDQTHWQLVRVIVCSLWRSKLVSSKSQISHTNILHLVFDDGVVVALKEREFVEKLASQHQAAPSEFQILTALVHEIDRQSKLQSKPPPSSKSNNADNNGDWSRKKLAKRLVKSIVKSSPIPITCTVGIESNARYDLVSRFYDHSSTVTKREAIGTEPDELIDYGLLMVMDIATPREFSRHSMLSRRTAPKQAEGKPHHETREIYRQLLSASRKLQIPTTQQKILPNNNDWCWDREAASIIAIQHMCYQNRVFARPCCQEPFKQAAAGSSKQSCKKRKKPS